MPPVHKPRHRSGYSREETLQVESLCLTLVATLGAYIDDLCIVGGLVPSLLIDRDPAADRSADDLHPGTNDLDVGLAVAILDQRRYAMLRERLVQEGFHPKENEEGNAVRQTWQLENLKVTIDFLIPPTPELRQEGRLQNLQPDFAALVTNGLQFAFQERVEVEVDGHTLAGERLKRMVPVCGPASFVVLKALAFADRVEPKDAFDLVYVLSHFPGSPASVVEKLAERAVEDAELVGFTLGKLANDFAELDSIGPRRAAEFGNGISDFLDDETADAHGFVDDFLKACGARGLTTES